MAENGTGLLKGTPKGPFDIPIVYEQHKVEKCS